LSIWADIAQLLQQSKLHNYEASPPTSPPVFWWHWSESKWTILLDYLTISHSTV